MGEVIYLEDRKTKTDTDADTESYISTDDTDQIVDLVANVLSTQIRRTVNEIRGI